MLSARSAKSPIIDQRPTSFLPVILQRIFFLEQIIANSYRMSPLSSFLLSQPIRLSISYRQFSNRLLQPVDFVAPLPSTSRNSDNVVQNIQQLLASLDDDNRRRLEDCIIDYNLFKNSGSTMMPSSVSISHWRRLMDMNPKDRIWYLTYWYEKEEEKRMNKMLRQREKMEAMERTEIDMENQEKNGKRKNGIFRWQGDPAMNGNWKSRLANALMFGPRLIIDMSLLPALRNSEWGDTGTQLVTGHCYNRMHRFPHHLVFTGCNHSHESWTTIQRYFGDKMGMYTFTEDHYLDLFPKEQLVYLSPDANLELNEYDYDKVYIIGALVNKFSRPGLTQRTAQEDGIETRKLPLHKIKFVGRQSLCLSHVIRIMNELHAKMGMEETLEKVLSTIEPGSRKRKNEKMQRRLLEFLKLTDGRYI